MSNTSPSCGPSVRRSEERRDGELLVIGCSQARDRYDFFWGVSELSHLTFEPDSDGFSLEAKATLSEWAGFQLRLGTDGSKGRDGASDGLVTVTYAPEGRGTEPLTADDQRLVRWFEDHHAEQAEPILSAVFAAYPAFKQAYREDYELDDVDDILPDISGPKDLRSLIELNGVFIHQLDVSGVPYIGYEFECAWDAEHALGVLMHGTRVAVVGDANVAFTRWVAKRDAAGRQ